MFFPLISKGIYRIYPEPYWKETGIKRGKLKAKKIGRAYYITEPNFMDFLEAK